MDEILEQGGVQDTNPTPTETVVDTPVDATPTPEENPYLLPVDDEQPQDTPDPQINDGLKQYLEISPYVNSPEALQGAIQDSHLLWDVINGQQPAGNILEGLKQSNQPAWQNLVNGLAHYIQQETGYAFVDPNSLPQQQELDPVQHRLNSIEQQFRQQEEAREAQVLQYRAQQAQTVLMSHLSTALKGTFLEGDEAQVLNAIGSKLGDPKKVIEAIEKGDFKAVDSALKQIRREETERYNRYVNRIASQKKPLTDSLPKVDNNIKPEPKGKFDLSTREGRIAFMQSQ